MAQVKTCVKCQKIKRSPARRETRRGREKERRRFQLWGSRTNLANGEPLTSVSIAKHSSKEKSFFLKISLKYFLLEKRSLGFLILQFIYLKFQPIPHYFPKIFLQQRVFLPRHADAQIKQMRNAQAPPQLLLLESWQK